MIDPMAYFESDCNEYYCNAVERVICEKVSLKEAGKKVLLFLADIIDWILKMINKIIDWFKGLFKKKKNKSCEQILIELGVVSQSDIDSGKIVIPKSDDSTVIPMQPTDIDFALKPLIVEFKNDQTLMIRYRDIFKSEMNNAKDGKIRGQNDGMTGPLKVFHGSAILGIGRPVIAMYFIKNIDNSRSDLLKYCQIIGRGYTVNSSLDDLDNYIQSVYANAKKFYKHNRKGYEIRISEMEDFSKVLSQCGKLLRAYDDSSSTAPKEFYQSASKIANVMTQLQYGLNDITKCLKGVYIIAPTYCNSIRDISVLSEFVEKMIDAGIPSKYIGFNVYMASHGDLKGKGNPLDPVWGQSRVIFFPIINKGVVYKIALNGVGIRGNRIEASTWATISQTKYASMFASISSVSKNRCVIEMERCDCNRKGLVHKAVLSPDVKKQVKDMCAELNMPNDISVDIHANNIGWKDGHICIIDYGNAEARA